MVDKNMPKYSVHGPEKHKAKGIPANFFIKIESGPYAGVEYCYNTIRNKGVDESDKYHLTFDYVVLYSPPHLPQVIQAEFEGVLWLILLQILEETTAAIESKEVSTSDVMVVDELDTTKDNEFKPEELYHRDQKPESD